MTRVTVLMYHALYRTNEDLLRIDPPDRPYAVQIDEFVRQLDLLTLLGLEVTSLNSNSAAVGTRRAVVLSFDDGHVSNYELAFPELLRRGWAAVFFVTSDFIGQRRGFCNWQQLGEMARGGMIIGSHGKTHRFLDSLSLEELDRELRGSASAIEEGVHMPVNCISFPGGRYDRRCLRIGRAMGWRYFFTSELGDNDRHLLVSGGRIRRVAIRNSTSVDSLRQLLTNPNVLRGAALRERLKRCVRLLIGNRAYHALYERFSR